MYTSKRRGRKNLSSRYFYHLVVEGCKQYDLDAAIKNRTQTLLVLLADGGNRLLEVEKFSMVQKGD